MVGRQPSSLQDLALVPARNEEEVDQGDRHDKRSAENNPGHNPSDASKGRTALHDAGNGNHRDRKRERPIGH
jgi:hypothetical protein